MDVTCRAFYFVGQCRHYYGLSGLVETALVAARCGTNLVVSECMPAIATLQFEKVPILAVPLYLMLQPDAALLQATTWVVNFSVTTHTVFAVPVTGTSLPPLVLLSSEPGVNSGNQCSEDAPNLSSEPRLSTGTDRHNTRCHRSCYGALSGGWHAAPPES